MIPTIHCAVGGCLSTCDLSSKDKNRVPDALKERGWKWHGEKGSPDTEPEVIAYCPNCMPLMTEQK